MLEDKPTKQKKNTQICTLSTMLNVQILARIESESNRSSTLRINLLVCSAKLSVKI